MSKNPWLKFYPTDWRSDEQLRNCSIAARGLWIEMLCLMHRASPYGHLIINGEVLTDAQLAIQTGTPSEQIPALVGELEKAGVFSRTGKGAIYSRKMVRDEKKANVNAKNGQNGGASKHKKVNGYSPVGNRNPSETENLATPQNPDPRIQIDKIPPYPPPGGGEGFDILNLISEDGLMDARSHAPGWDIQGYLAPIYTQSVRSGKLQKPRSPNKAFPAWCKSYTKGKTP